MKKELFSALTILSLVAGAVINIVHLNKLVNTMTQHIDKAIVACSVTDYNTAEAELSAALTLWVDSDSYTHVFIRHSEIDATTDSYYDALAAIQSKNQEAISLMRKTQYHIESIQSMEKVSLKSIF